MSSASPRRLRASTAAALALVTSLFAGVAVACARDASSQGTHATAADSTNRPAPVVALRDSATGDPNTLQTVRTTAAGVSAGAAAPGPTLPMKGIPTPAPVAGANSAAALAVVPIGPNGPQLQGGRSKQDAESFGATIRTGTKQLAVWPKGPSNSSGALLPNKLIVAFYGNPHSKKMGVLGEYPSDQMLAMLDREVVILTGAMTPLGFEGTDGLQNLTESLLAARVISPGIYVVMQNEVFPISAVTKDRARGRFIST